MYIMSTMISVKSDHIAAIGYSKQMLRIRFHNGRAIKYFFVPKNIYDAFLSAPSKNDFFVGNIRGKYSQAVIK